LFLGQTCQDLTRAGDQEPCGIPWCEQHEEQLLHHTDPAEIHSQPQSSTRFLKEHYSNLLRILQHRPHCRPHYLSFLSTNQPRLLSPSPSDHIKMSNFMDIDLTRRNKKPRPISETERAKLEEFIENIHYSARFVHAPKSKRIRLHANVGMT
jgi:hypothetical protein